MQLTSCNKRAQSVSEFNTKRVLQIFWQLYSYGKCKTIKRKKKRNYTELETNNHRREEIEQSRKKEKRESRAYRGGARYFRECQRVFIELRNSAKLINAEGTFQESADGARPSSIARITNEFRRMIIGYHRFHNRRGIRSSIPVSCVSLAACTLQARVLPFHADDPESTALPTGPLSTIARTAGVSDSLVRRSSNATNATRKITVPSVRS